MQGWRSSNEDTHIALLDFRPGFSLLAVFDGHGGAEVAKFCENHFVKELLKDSDFNAGNYEQALKNTFLTVDNLLLRPNGRKELLRYSRMNENMVPGDDYAQTAGTTANVALVTPSHIYVANAGDSRCVASVQD